MKYENKLSANLNVMLNVFKKNFLEGKRYPINFIFMLIEPIVFFIPYFLLSRTFTRDGFSAGLDSWIGNNDFDSFLMIGMIAAYIIDAIFWQIGFSLRRLMEIGILETIWSSPVSKISYILAESLFSIFQMIYKAVILLFIFFFVFHVRVSFDLVGSIPYLILLIVLMYSLGMILSGIILLTKNPENLIDTANFFTITLSGAYNPPKAFPRLFFCIALAIPITYLIDILRYKAMGINLIFSLRIEIIICVISAIIVPIFSAWLFKRIDKICRRKGIIHTY